MGAQGKHRLSAWTGWQGKTIAISIGVIVACLLVFAAAAIASGRWVL